jgi:hypothetical protein
MHLLKHGFSEPLAGFTGEFFVPFYCILHMTSQELKTEIQKSLDKVPAAVLQDVLNFLKEAESQPTEFLRAHNLREILEEDKELLERLAQ